MTEQPRPMTSSEEMGDRIMRAVALTMEGMQGAIRDLDGALTVIDYLCRDTGMPAEERLRRIQQVTQQARQAARMPGGFPRAPGWD